MGKFYIGGLGLGIILFIIMWIVGGVSNCAIRSQEKNRVEEVSSETIIVRYYKDPVTAENAPYTGEVGVIRVTKGEKITMSVPADRDGKSFAGLCATPYFDAGQLYVDGSGKGKLPVTGDIVLYALYAD